MRFPYIRIYPPGQRPYRLLVAVASDDHSIRKGLSGLRAMPRIGGMLFWFGRFVLEPFTTREMLFPIDIVFIGGNGQVVHVIEDARPGDARLHRSPVPYYAVLEVPSGFARDHGIGLGTTTEM